MYSLSILLANTVSVILFMAYIFSQHYHQQHKVKINASLLVLLDFLNDVLEDKVEERW
jgi:hypothetical protein